jgi:hypothetical protein
MSTSASKPQAESVAFASFVLGTLNPGGEASAAGGGLSGAGQVPPRAAAEATSPAERSWLTFESLRFLPADEEAENEVEIGGVARKEEANSGGGWPLVVGLLEDNVLAG